MRSQYQNNDIILEGRSSSSGSDSKKNSSSSESEGEVANEYTAAQAFKMVEQVNTNV